MIKNNSGDDQQQATACKTLEEPLPQAFPTQKAG